MTTQYALSSMPIILIIIRSRCSFSSAIRNRHVRQGQKNSFASRSRVRVGCEVASESDFCWKELGKYAHTIGTRATGKSN